MQPDHPIYPRPVPYIDVNEDILLPGATVLTSNERNDEDFDADGIAARRAAKRRRIQLHAHAYLRGEGISILSASLRGPFNSNWNNPWLRNDLKASHIVKVTGIGHVDNIPSSSVHGSSRLSRLGKSTSVRTPVPPTKVLTNPFQKVNELFEPPHSNEKVEGWLRRNDELPQQPEPAAPPSPTPKSKSSPEIFRQAPKYRWTPTKQLITINSQDIRAPANPQPTRIQEAFDDDISSQEVNIAPKHAHSRLQNALRSDTRDQDFSPNTANKLTHNIRDTTTNTDRAEAEILKLKRHAVEDLASVDSDKHAKTSSLSRELPKVSRLISGRPEQNSLATPPVSDQEQAEEPARVARIPQEGYKPMSVPPESLSQITSTPWKRGNNAATRLALEAAFLLAAQRPSHSQDKDVNTTTGDKSNRLCRNVSVSQAKTNKIPLPELSINASDVQVYQLPPSAQQKPPLQAMPSNASSSLRLLEALSTVASVQQQVEQEHNGTADQALPGEPIHDPSQSNHIPLKLDFTISEPSQIGEQAVNPINTACDQDGQKNAPLLASEATSKSSPPKQKRRGKITKRASYIPEASSLSSNESIRSVLRVGKLNAESNRTFKLPPPPSTKTKISMEDLEDENNPQSTPVRLLRNGRKVRSPIGKSTGRKGILKMSSTPFLASRQNVQNPGPVDDDDFDLNGAIDEMGSFLSTWDAEKDVLKVA